MKAAIRFKSVWAAAALFLALLGTASEARAWNEDTHQSIVQLSYQVINLVDYEKNRRDQSAPNTAVFPQILVDMPPGATAAEWESFLTVVGASRGRLGELVIGADREELDEHSGNILCAPPVARRLKTIDEFPFGQIATNAKQFNSNPTPLPPCQKLKADEYQFGGIYNNRLLDLAQSDGPHTGSMLGWLSAGVDSRIDDWVPVFVPLEAALNFLSALLNGGDPDSPAGDFGGGVLLVLALVLLFALAGVFLGPIGAALTAGLLLASFFEYNVTDFITNPRDYSGSGHFINVQEPVPYPFSFPAFPGLPTQIPSNTYDDHQGKDLEQAYFLRGPGLANAVQDSFDHYVLDKAGLGASVDHDQSFGPSHYQITDPDDGDRASSPFRDKDYWEDNDLSEVTFTPLDNLGYYGWRKWRSDSCKKVETLHWPLHALGDASAPHHVVGATGLGHRPFEDIVQFSNVSPGPPGSPPGPDAISPQWNAIIHEGNAAAGRDQARRILHEAFKWSKVIRGFQQSHPGDIPVRQLVTRVAQRTLELIRTTPAEISCTPNACRTQFPSGSNTGRTPGLGGLGGASGSAGDAGAGDAGAAEPEPAKIVCDGTCSGITVKSSCIVTFTPSQQEGCTVNEYIALELSKIGGKMPAVFPPGLSHYYDGAFTNEGRAYYSKQALIDEQRKFIELGTGATLAFLAHSAELVSTPVSEEECLCDDPLVRCEGVCRDLNTDPQHCGTCGLACVSGTCCNGRCVSVLSDESNCGRCGKQCNLLTQCTNGICSCPNPAQSACPDLCTNLQTDDNNCGFCGNRCKLGSCNAGHCPVQGPD